MGKLLLIFLFFVLSCCSFNDALHTKRQDIGHVRRDAGDDDDTSSADPTAEDAQVEAATGGDGEPAEGEHHENEPEHVSKADMFEVAENPSHRLGEQQEQPQQQQFQPGADTAREVEIAEDVRKQMELQQQQQQQLLQSTGALVKEQEQEQQQLQQKQPTLFPEPAKEQAGEEQEQAAPLGQGEDVEAPPQPPAAPAPPSTEAEADGDGASAEPETGDNNGGTTNEEVAPVDGPQPSAGPPLATVESDNKPPVVTVEGGNKLPGKLIPGIPPTIQVIQNVKTTLNVSTVDGTQVKSKTEVTTQVIAEMPDEPPEEQAGLQLLESWPLAGESTPPEEMNNTNNASVPRKEFNFKLDKDSCSNWVSNNSIPHKILLKTIERVLDRLSSDKCTNGVDLKLSSATNKRIKGQVMETSSIKLDLNQFFGATSKLRPVQVQCHEWLKGTSLNAEPIGFVLKFHLEPQDHVLRSLWRHYSRFESPNDFPIDMNGGKLSSNRASNGMGAGLNLKRGSHGSSKCRRFKLQSGVYNLELLSLKQELLFEVGLVRLSEMAYGASDQLGGRLQLVDFQVRQLYLDHVLEFNKDRLRPPSSTVQILHDHNGHQRRNNWLLDLYANWLAHEYRRQLAHLLKPNGPLQRQLNHICLADRPADPPAAAADGA